MKNKNLCIAILTAGLLVSTVMSCKKDLLKTNPNNLTVSSYFNTSDQIQLATNSVYVVLRSYDLMSREWFFVHDMRGDDMATGGGQLEAARAQILNGPPDPTNAVMGAVWTGLYTMIHRANTVIVNAPRVPSTDNPTLVARCVGEAKFLRAWAYFDLVTMWGGVPIHTQTVSDPTVYTAKSTPAQVYAQIAADLKDAIAVLPNKSGYAAADLGRATKSAAYMLQARALMQTGDYAGAKAALLLIPTAGADGYSLTSRFLDNFEEETEFSQEVIFEVINFDKKDGMFNYGGTGDGINSAQSTLRTQEYNTLAWRNLIPSNKILNEFESTVTGATKTDPRYSYSVYQTGDVYNNGLSVLADADQNGNSSIVHGVTIKTGWRKYMEIYKMSKAQAATYYGGNDTRVYRYAEVLLNLAECENELGNTASAVGYLNQVRARADVLMPPYPTAQYPVGSKNQVTAALMHEKSVEMADEEVRNIDILRWRAKGYYPSIAPEPIAFFKAGRDELLPYPQSELDNNPLLNHQNNPGY
ncbi:MAG TPA: RagB/SusD family nutrient uptake outer membrane protein [Mucilaginibacter sp.]